MRANDTIIGLSPSAVEIAQFHGGACVAYDRVAISPADWSASWSKQFRNIDGALQQAVRKLGVKSSAGVDVVYSGPDTIVEVIGNKASGVDAESAARLALAENMPGGVEGRPHHLRVLAVDQAGAERLTHVLAAAERDESAQAVVAWVQRAGLTVRSLIPAGAVAVTDAVEKVISASASGTVSLLLVCEHRTIIAAASAGTLLCVRSVAFGFDAMADAFVRASASRSEGEPDPGANYCKAMDAVLSLGIPTRSQAIGIAGLLGEHVLPFLQPVLQRYVVEIRQTLRFALGESELARSSLILTGPGAAIPQLADVLTSQIEIPVTIDDSCAKMRLIVPGSDMPLAARVDRSGYRFLPHMEVVRREGLLRKRCLMAGAGLAGVVLAGDALLAMGAARSVGQEMREIIPSLKTVREDEELRANAAKMASRVNAEQAAVREALGERPDWGALFSELSRLSAPPVRLLELSVTQTINGYSASIRGVTYVEKNEQGEASDSLGSYIATLQTSPLIRSVELGSTRLGEVDGKSVKHFLVTARLTGLPVTFAEWEAQP